MKFSTLRKKCLADICSGNCGLTDEKCSAETCPKFAAHKTLSGAARSANSRVMQGLKPHGRKATSYIIGGAWFAINDTELRQFHMAGLLAGGGDAVLPVINEIRGRKISYTKVAEKPAANTQTGASTGEDDAFA